MAKAFVKQYKHLPDTHQQCFNSRYSLAKSRFVVDDFDGTFELCDWLLKIYDAVTSNGKGIEVRRKKGNVLTLMGTVFLRRQQFDDPCLYLNGYRNSLSLFMGKTNSPQVKETNKKIVWLKEKIGIGVYSHQEKGGTAAELVWARERFRENQECVDIMDILFFHSSLVRALREDGRLEEAMDQIEKLLAQSRQSLGPTILTLFCSKTTLKNIHIYWLSILQQYLKR